jgi:hypothetical protein
MDQRDNSITRRPEVLLRIAPQIQQHAKLLSGRDGF